MCVCEFLFAFFRFRVELSDPASGSVALKLSPLPTVAISCLVFVVVVVVAATFFAMLKRITVNLIVRLAHFEVSLKAHKDFRSTLLKGNNKQKLVCHHRERERKRVRWGARGRERERASSCTQRTINKAN